MKASAVQDLLAPGASNFYAVNDYIAAATFQVPAKAFVLSGLMSEEQVSASVAVPCLKDKLFV
jgi:hypothetical protein